MLDKMICNHCGYPVSIRNPSGKCDHLYYPDCCPICKILKPDERVTYIDDFISEKEMEL